MIFSFSFSSNCVRKLLKSTQNLIFSFYFSLNCVRKLLKFKKWDRFLLIFFKLCEKITKI